MGAGSLGVTFSPNLCRLLETRYLVAERVYFHHAKIAASVMLGRAIEEARISDEITEEDLWDLGDEVVLERLRESASATASQLATEVSERKLYEEYHVFGWEDVEKSQSHSHLTNQYNDVIQVRVGTADARREFENEVADIVAADPGDVLIYAPEKKMNRKEAEVNVLWKGHPEFFKDIDDPVVKPRLEATLQAHKLLWSIRIFVRRSMSEEQKRLAKQLCEIELLSGTTEQLEKKRATFNEVIRLALVADDRSIPPSASEYEDKLDRIAGKLTVVGHEGESFSKRLRKTINQEFGETTP